MSISGAFNCRDVFLSRLCSRLCSKLRLRHRLGALFEQNSARVWFLSSNLVQIPRREQKAQGVLLTGLTILSFPYQLSLNPLQINFLNKPRRLMRRSLGVGSVQDG